MKNKFLTFWLPIILGLAIGFSIIGVWTWYLLTLPDYHEQLKYSPFENDGVWLCEDYDFTITSTLIGTGEYDEDGEEYKERIVEGELNKDGKTYNFDLWYTFTRGFDHTYAVVITIGSKNTSDAEAVYSCYYDFKENDFTLKDLSYMSGDKVFEGVRELHFIKQTD